jgi:hypothetical protein
MRQSSTTGLVAVLALGAMFILCQPAGASNPTHFLSVLLSQDPAKGDDPPADDPEQGKDKKAKAKDEKPNPYAKDVKTVKEYESPLVTDWMRGSRPHRDPVPELLIKNHRLAPEPTPEENRRLTDLRRVGGTEPKTPDDVALIDKAVKSLVYSLTDPKWFLPNAEGHKRALDLMKKNREEIEKVLEAKPGGINEKFATIYRQSATKYLTELLDNNLWVRANAMRLLAMVKDENAIRVFVAQIEDPKQHEGIKFLAIEGIESMGRGRLIANVQLESMAVNSLLNTLKKNEQVHAFTRQAAVRALGSIGRPTRVIGQPDADVAVALIKILRDPNIRRVDRNDVVVALSNLQIQPELDYNFRYVAYEIAQFAADVGAAALQNPSIDDLHGHLFLVDNALALSPEKKVPNKTSLMESAKKHPKANANGDPAYIRMLGDQVNRLTVSGLKAYKPEAVVAAKPAAQAKADDIVKRNKDITDRLQGGDFKAELAKLYDLLKSNPPRSMRITPDTDELGPPPALVGPREPVAKETEAIGTEKSSEKAAASSSPPGN